MNSRCSWSLLSFVDEAKPYYYRTTKAQRWSNFGKLFFASAAPRCTLACKKGRDIEKILEYDILLR